MGTTKDRGEGEGTALGDAACRDEDPIPTPCARPFPDPPCEMGEVSFVRWSWESMSAYMRGARCSPFIWQDER